MKIAIMSTQPPRECGIGLYASRLVNALRKKGHEVRVLSFKGYDYKDKYIVPIISKHNPFSYLKAANYLKRNGFDKLIVEYEYVFYNLLFFPFFLLLARLYNIKVALEFHTVVPYEDILKKGIFTLYHSALLLFTDHVIMHTNNARQKLQRKTLVTRPVRIIPIPIPMLKPNPKKAVPKKPLLLSFGFVSYDKGLDVLVKGLGSVGQVNVLIHGSVSPTAMRKQHDYYRKIKKMATAFSNIRIIDKFISEEEKAELFSRADFIVLPYRFIEQSAVLTEVWAHGKIPVCSDIRAFREEIGDDDYGVLFENNNPEDLRKKVLALIKDKKRQTKLLGNIKRLVRQRSFESLAEKYLF